MSNNPTFEQALKEAFDFIGDEDHSVIFGKDGIYVTTIRYCGECGGETTSISKVFPFDGPPTLTLKGDMTSTSSTGTVMF